RKLEEMEYLSVTKGNRGQQYVYQLMTEAAPGEDITRMIPTPQELKMRLKLANRRRRKVRVVGESAGTALFAHK
ncbi:MAG: hypothetical protein DRI57_27330, partial [Deltaproteobacteria bacterium]